MTATRLCACGCGQPTPISPKTDQAHGYVKGEPREFIPYHHLRKHQTAEQRRAAHLAQARAYNARHPDRKAATRRAYLAQPNAWAKHLAAGRRQHARDPEKTRMQTTSWRTRYPNRWRNIVRRRAERRANAAGENPILDDLFADMLRRDPCCYCGALAGTIDHIVPLSEGGRGDWHNLTAACLNCNSSKHTTPLLLWLARDSRVPWQSSIARSTN